LRNVAVLAWAIAALILVLNFKLLYDTVAGVG
jgi:manganese transport protein